MLSRPLHHDRFLPDKAIDLIDEAASRLRIENDSMPAELDEIRRRMMQLQIELEALRKEKDPASQAAAREGREASWPSCRRSNTQLTAPLGEREGRDGRGSRTSRSSSTRKQVELEQAQRQGNWEAAARIQYGEMRDLQAQLDEAEERAPRADAATARRW